MSNLAAIGLRTASCALLGCELISLLRCCLCRDTYLPDYELSPSTLSKKARIQLLRAIGLAIVKKGSMFPTMEILLRHASEFYGG